MGFVVCVCFARFEILREEEFISSLTSLYLSLSPPWLSGSYRHWNFNFGFGFFFSSLLFCISVPEFNRIVFSGEEVLSLSLSLSPLPCFRFG